MYSFKWENWFIDSDWSEFYFDKFILFWFSNVERLLKLNIYFDHEFYFNCLIFFTIILLNGNLEQVFYFSCAHQNKTLVLDFI